MKKKILKCEYWWDPRDPKYAKKESFYTSYQLSFFFRFFCCFLLYFTSMSLNFICSLVYKNTLLVQGFQSWEMSPFREVCWRGAGDLGYLHVSTPSSRFSSGAIIASTSHILTDSLAFILFADISLQHSNPTVVCLFSVIIRRKDATGD